MNEVTGVDYEMVVGDRSDSQGDGCREFGLQAEAAGQVSRRSGVACKAEDGIWEVA